MAALSILTVKFVAMGLTKELAGNYNSAYGFLQLFGILADFGLYAVAVREVARAPEQSSVRGKPDGSKQSEVLGALIVLRCAILVLSLATALLLVWIIPAWRGTPLPLAVTIASLVPFFTLMAGIVRTVFQVKYKMHYVFIAEVVQRIFTTAMIGSFIFLGVRGSNDLQILHMFLFIGGMGAFILFFMSLIYGNRLMRIRMHFDLEMLKRLLKAATPYGLAFLFMAFYRQFDITLIALLRDDFELQNAYYGFVLRMVEMGYLIPTFLLNSTLPILSERSANGGDTKSLLGKTFLIILILGSVSFLFSILWSRPLIQLLTTDAYLSTATRAGSDTALRLMSVPIFLNGIIAYSFYVLLTKHEWRKLVAMLLVGAVFSLGLNLWLIPQYGFQGAATVSIIVHCFLAAMLLPLALRTMPMHLPKEQWMRWGAFTSLLAGALWAYQPYLTNEFATVFALVSVTILMGVLGLLCGFRKTLL